MRIACCQPGVLTSAIQAAGTFAYWMLCSLTPWGLHPLGFCSVKAGYFKPLDGFSSLVSRNTETNPLSPNNSCIDFYVNGTFQENTGLPRAPEGTQTFVCAGGGESVLFRQRTSVESYRVGSQGNRALGWAVPYLAYCPAEICHSDCGCLWCRGTVSVELSWDCTTQDPLPVLFQVRKTVQDRES